MPASGKRAGKFALDTSPSLGFVERLRGSVLLKHPQVQADGRAAADDLPSSFGYESRADPLALESVAHVEVVEEDTPRWIDIEDHVSEPPDCALSMRNDGVVDCAGP